MMHNVVSSSMNDILSPTPFGHKRLEYFPHYWNSNCSFNHVLINQAESHLCLLNILTLLNFNNVHFILHFFQSLLHLYDILEQCLVVTYSNPLHHFNGIFIKCHLLPDGLVLTSVNHQHLL